MYICNKQNVFLASPCMHCNTVVISVSSLRRGFGFVTFTDAASVDKVLAQQHHELDSKTVSSFFFFFITYTYISVCALFWFSAALS